jgi:hypothetical protein
MSASFIAMVFVALLLLVYWRLVVLVLAACLLAMLVYGLGVIEPESGSAAPARTLAPPEPGSVSPDDVGLPLPR